MRQANDSDLRVTAGFHEVMAFDDVAHIAHAHLAANIIQQAQHVGALTIH